MDGASSLQTLLHDVCAESDGAALAARWGKVEPSQTRVRGLHVTCAPESPFAALELRPWSNGAAGVVDVELRPGNTWKLADVDRRFGPLRSQPVFESGEVSSVVDWSEAELPASALLIVWVSGDQVNGITIRRDPR